MWTMIFGLPTTLSINAEAQTLNIVDAQQVQQRLVSAQTNLNERISKLP
ncbi:MAG: hypothetical protein QGG67_08070 [Gammaproteobacteria bacterium]|jgi:hypothetical protein|nr:hypothetical protein [Gammaproteobacteria bacterium]|tara:strand:- start:689 stop:835 length:147 start_codon:yes stop_codon:yes gene_type:complete